MIEYAQSEPCEFRYNSSYYWQILKPRINRHSYHSFHWLLVTIDIASGQSFAFTKQQGNTKGLNARVVSSNGLIWVKARYGQRVLNLSKSLHLACFVDQSDLYLEIRFFFWFPTSMFRIYMSDIISDIRKAFRNNCYDAWPTKCTKTK